MNSNTRSPRSAILQFLREVLAQVTEGDTRALREDQPFEALGIHSLMALQLTEAMESTVPNLPRTLFFEHRNLGELATWFERHAAGHFAGTPSDPQQPMALPVGHGSLPLVPSASRAQAPAAPVAPRSVPHASAAGSPQEPSANALAVDPLALLARRLGVAVPSVTPLLRAASSDIAIVGLAGRYPGAQDLDQFWLNLAQGRDSISEVPRTRWNHDAIYDADRQRSDKVYAKWGGFLDDVATFDPLFFRISPQEAQWMDPQERLFLQAAWHAVENAGYRPGSLAGQRVGVFVGAMWSHYQLYGAQAMALGQFNPVGSTFAAIANRVSHVLDLVGPSLAVDSMCSSSLSAIHLAMQSLREGECSSALAGGVNLTLHPHKYVLLSRNNFASTDGRCRAFGAGGDGYVPGEGVGCVLLKRLDEALAAGDHIYGVIKGSAINHGGRAHGFTVPNPKAQAQVIAQAMVRAGGGVQSLSYIEAHGTGTALGDPIELAGLQEALGADPRTPIAIGSVKSNIGHLEAAAGMAGLTKVLLQLQHRQLVPSLHASSLNPHVQWDRTGFQVQTQLGPWVRADGAPLRAGLSAFGAGGSNAHLVIEQAPGLAAPSADRAGVAPHNVPTVAAQAAQWLLLSARSPSQLKQAALQLAQWFLAHGARHTLADVAYTLRVGRDHQAHRLALKVADAQQGAAALRAVAQGLQPEPHVICVRGDTPAAPLEQALHGQAMQTVAQHLWASSSHEALARLWCAGCDLPWEVLYAESTAPSAPGERPTLRRVPLPGSVWAGKPLWAPTGSPLAAFDVQAQQHAPLAPLAPVSRVPPVPLLPVAMPEDGTHGQEHWLTPTWVDAAPPAPAPGALPVGALLLIGPKPLPLLQRWLDDGGAQRARLVVVQHQAGAAAGDLSRCDLTDDRTAAAFVQRWLATASTPGDPPAPPGLIDAIDLCEREGRWRAPHGRMALLQALARATKPTEGEPARRWLHLAADDTQADGEAAVVQALVRLLPHEYQHIQARSVVLDERLPAPAFEQALHSAWHSAQPLAGRFGVNSPSELSAHSPSPQSPSRYQVLALRAMAQPPADFQADPDKVYLITGGTGGIGLAIAAWLAEQGVRKLALTGLRALPERALWPALLADAATDPAVRRRLQALSALPASTRLLAGPLSDAAALEPWLAELRAWGELDVVFHAAGRVDSAHPAWVHKTAASLAGVLEPKLEGVAALIQALRAAPPRLLALFSSVSGLYPELGVGLSDYAAANHALHAAARQAHARGETWVRAVVWQNWAQVGLGELRSERLQQRGLLGLGTEQGLQLLNRALAPGLPAVVFPAWLVPERAKAALSLQPLLTPPQGMAKRAEPQAERSMQPAAARPTPSRGQPKDVANDPAEGAAHDAASLALLLRERLAPVLNMDLAEWAIEANFADLGVDSILIASLHQHLETWLQRSLDPGLFLERPSLAQLAQALWQTHGRGLLPASALVHPIDEAAALPVLLLPEIATVTELATVPAGVAGAAASQAKPQSQPQAQREPAAVPPPALARAPAAAHTPAQAMRATRFAIVGMACRFPGAPTLERFRSNLREGVSAITPVPASRWDVQTHYRPALEKGKSTGQWGGFVQDLESFDAQAYELPAEVAPQVDPLIRLSLGVSVDSLRDAGYEREELKGRAIGVFMGSRVANYTERIRDFGRHSVTAVGQNFIAAHISQLFDLTGPALVVDSACSSSLLAVHLACQSLALGECEAAIAGGADVLLDERPYQMLSQGRALSPTGQCRTFDDQADGFVPGEGAGAVLLKTLERALEDGDRIYAVIEGSATNNDGRTMGITTPNPLQQQAVIRAALSRAGADASTVGYVEAHGTGTRIGDPIELRGLTTVFRQDTAQTGYCAIGSVKTGIGHLLSAAGVASLIKVALSVSHGELYPSLNCNTPNPRFAFDSSPFYVNTQCAAWQPPHGVRRAGISSFGFGGTNVHTVLSDAYLQRARPTPVRRAALPAWPVAGTRQWLDAQPAPVDQHAAAQPPSITRFVKASPGLAGEPPPAVALVDTGAMPPVLRPVPQRASFAFTRRV